MESAVNMKKIFFLIITIIIIVFLICVPLFIKKEKQIVTGAEWTKDNFLIAHALGRN